MAAEGFCGGGGRDEFEQRLGCFGLSAAADDAGDILRGGLRLRNLEPGLTLVGSGGVAGKGQSGIGGIGGDCRQDGAGIVDVQNFWDESVVQADGLEIAL